MGDVFFMKGKGFPTGEILGPFGGFLFGESSKRRLEDLEFVSLVMFDGFYHGQSPLLINPPFGEYVTVLFFQPPDLARKS